MGKLVEKLKEFPSNFMIELLKTFLMWAILGIISYISTNIIEKYGQNFKEYSLWIIILAIIIGLLILIRVIQKYNKYKPVIPNFEGDYVILEKEITHKTISKTELFHQRRFKIKALRNSVYSFRDKFVWTGGQYKIYTNNKNHEIQQIGKINFYDGYEVRFNKVLKKGDIEEIEVCWDLSDTEGKAVPFFKTIIEEPTENLKMNLELPVEFKVTDAVCEVSFTSNMPIECKTQKLKNNRLVWEIPNPRLLYNYEIRWKV